MSLAPLTGHYSPRSTAYSPPQTKIPSLNNLDSLSGLLDGGPLSVRSNASLEPSIVPPVLSPSSTVNLSQLDDGLQRQSIARKTRDLKLGTLETDVEDVTTTLRLNEKKMAALAGAVEKLKHEVEEERSARRLLEKVLLKMAEEQTMKVVEAEVTRERAGREAQFSNMKTYVDLVHDKVTRREREAAGERSVTRAMLQMLGKTRRSVNSLAAEVQAAKGDLEERIANDIVNLNSRCKELQLAINHESLRAAHEADGLRQSTSTDMATLRQGVEEQLDRLREQLGSRVTKQGDDLAALQSALSTEQAVRNSGDEMQSTRLVETATGLKEALSAEMSQRAEDEQARHKAVEASLQNVFMNLQKERQLREEEVAQLQQSLHAEGHVRHTENTQLTELLDRLARRVQTGMHVDQMPLSSELDQTRSELDVLQHSPRPSQQQQLGDP